MIEIMKHSIHAWAKHESFNDWPARLFSRVAETDCVCPSASIPRWPKAVGAFVEVVFPWTVSKSRAVVSVVGRAPQEHSAGGGSAGKTTLKKRAAGTLYGSSRAPTFSIRKAGGRGVCLGMGSQ